MKLVRKLFLFLCSFFIISSTAVTRVDDFDDFENFEIPEIKPLTSEEMMVTALQAIIKEPMSLWDRSSLERGRDVLYLLPYKIIMLDRAGFAFTFFYNSVHRMHVTVNDLFNTEGILIALEEIVKLLSTSNNVQEIRRIAPFLRKMSIQERKGGAFIQASFSKGPFIFEMNTSFLFSERNFWLSSFDQKHIKNIIARHFPQASSENGELYRLRFGIGDTRLKLGLNLINRSDVQIDIGCESIIPTSQITRSRIKGITFVNDQDKSEIENKFRHIIDALLGRARDLILEPRLGNDGHIGLGIYLEGQINRLGDNIVLWTRFSYDNFFAADENRLFLFRQTISPDALTPKNLSEFLKQSIIPSVFAARVKPGGVLNMVIGASMACKRWRIGFGYDFFLQRKEDFIDIHHCFPDLLLTEKARTPYVKQHKFFLDSTWTKKYKQMELDIGIGGDVTVASSGVGKDWTMYTKVGFLF